MESDDDGDDDAGAEPGAEADAEPTYGCSRCRFSRNGCYDSFDWSGRNGGRGCRPDAWRGPSQYHVDGEVAASWAVAAAVPSRGLPASCGRPPWVRGPAVCR